MEYSLARSLENSLEISTVPFPHLSSDPAIDQVNPGIGHLVSLYETVVPMQGHSLHAIEKKVELALEQQTDELNPQVGGGKSNIEPSVLNSFKNPIVTDSIIFPKGEKAPLKRTKMKDDSEQEIHIVIHVKNNSVPAKTVKVAPINNILHSMFESVSLKINDQPITKSASNYPYKAYITNTLTYPSFVKVSQLQTEGFYSDLAGHMGPVSNNTGFNQRNQIFRKEDKSDTEYKPEGVRFFGRLQIDLIGCQTGLIPGTKVEIEVKNF